DGRARRADGGTRPDCGVRRSSSGDDPQWVGAGGARLVAVLLLRPDRPRAGSPTGRRLCPITLGAVGTGGHDGGDPARRAEQRDRRPKRGRRDHDPRRALRPSLATATPRRRARRTAASYGREGMTMTIVERVVALQ